MNIEELIKEGRGAQVDFILTIDNPYKVAQIMVSLTNSKGGSIFIGVKENRKVCGVHPEQELLLLDEVVRLIEGEINFSHSTHQIKHCLVLEIMLESSPKSVRAKSIDGKWFHYIRIDSHTLKANKIFARFFYLRDKNAAVDFSENHARVLSELNQYKSNLSSLYSSLGMKPKEIDIIVSELLVMNRIECQFINESIIYFGI